MRYGSILLAAGLLLIGTAAQAQPDRLGIFDGIWVFVSAPVGQHVYFNRVGLGTREVSLPFGQAIVSVSDGRSGSNFKVSGAGFDCYYFVGQINPREMTWELKSGPDICTPSIHLKKDPP